MSPHQQFAKRAALTDEEMQHAAATAGFSVTIRKPAAGQRCMHKTDCADPASVEIYTGRGRLERILCRRHAAAYVMAGADYYARRAKREAAADQPTTTKETAP